MRCTLIFIAICALSMGATARIERSGADQTSNMQWQSVAEGKAKDRDERRMCRQLRKITHKEQP